MTRNASCSLAALVAAAAAFARVLPYAVFAALLVLADRWLATQRSAAVAT
jgi:hypothetical protein